MRISDWSSDVCSSDLNYPQLAATQCSPTCTRHMNPCRQLCSSCLTGWKRSNRLPQRFCVLHMRKSIKASWRKPDRKSVGKGKGVSVRLDIGGRRIIKKKTNIKIKTH